MNGQKILNFHGVLGNLGQDSSDLSNRKREDIGHQVQTGTFILNPVDCHALVISQGWLSWTFTLEELGLKSLLTLASFPSLGSQQEFLAMESGATLINKRVLPDWLSAHKTDGIVFVQGDCKFLEMTYFQMSITDELHLVYACSEESFWSADGSQISQAACGGVTDGKWTVYVQNLRAPSFKPSAVWRTFHHVLLSVEGPSSVKRLKGANHVPFGMDEKVRWGQNSHV